jgi:heme/copper-type cytochrome/quinol oxidase subunit 3
VTGDIELLPELLPPPEPVRPRTLLVGTVFAVVASVMVFAGMLALYLSERSAALEDDGQWLPDGVTIALTPGHMAMVTLAMSVVTMGWAVYAIGNDDRHNTYLALGLTVLLGAAYINEMAFYYSQMGFAVADPVGALVYGITGTHIAMTVGGLVFAALMTLRTLGGQYSSQNREGLAAAAVYWFAVVAMYAVIWLAIFITK